MGELRIDTEGAIADLRLAKSYLAQWHGAKNSDEKLLSLALKHLGKARSKDLTAKFSAQSAEGNTSLSIDQVTAEVLCAESVQYLGEGADPASLYCARDKLQNAIKFDPQNIQYHSRLADVFLRLNNKESALAVARDAVEANPQSADALKLLDRVDTSPVADNSDQFLTIPNISFAAGLRSFKLAKLGTGLIWVLFLAWGIPAAAESFIFPRQFAPVISPCDALGRKLLRNAGPGGWDATIYRRYPSVRTPQGGGMEVLREMSLRGGPILSPEDLGSRAAVDVYPKLPTPIGCLIEYYGV